MWEIEVPSPSKCTIKYELLMRLLCPRASLNPILNIICMPNYDTIIAGCEDGVFAWAIQDFKKQKPSDEM